MSASPHVLVVASDRAFAAYVTTLLRRDIFATTCAQDGPSAIDSLQSTSFDLVICTQHLPQWEGLEVFSALQAQLDPPPAFLLLTSDHSTTLKTRARDAGVIALLKIPFRPQQLLRVVKELTGLPDQMNEAE